MQSARESTIFLSAVLDDKEEADFVRMDAAASLASLCIEYPELAADALKVFAQNLDGESLVSDAVSEALGAIAGARPDLWRQSLRAAFRQAAAPAVPAAYIDAVEKKAESAAQDNEWTARHRKLRDRARRLGLD